MRSACARASCLALAAGIAVASGVARATSYYVREGGSDSAPGTTPQGAWLSMEKAFATAQAGDHVFVAPGTYIAATNYAPANSGNDWSTIDFIADTGAIEFNGWVSPGPVVLRSTDSSATLVISGKRRLFFYDFTIEAGTSATKSCPSATGNANCAILLTGGANENEFSNIKTTGDGTDYGVVITNSSYNYFQPLWGNWWGWNNWNPPSPSVTNPGFKGTGTGISIGSSADYNGFDWTVLSGKSVWSVEVLAGTRANGFSSLTVTGGGVKVESGLTGDWGSANGIWGYSLTKDPSVSSTFGILYSDPTGTSFGVASCTISG